MTALSRRLPHVPALDSLRAIAVIGVLAYHHDPATVPGGWLGVSMFFTLSGFLIAGLLLAEHEENDRIHLGEFWNRRLRRLLPASLAAIALTAVVVAVDASQRAGDVAVDVRAAVLNVANWHFVAQDAPYAGSEGVASPVQHYWSLAIEEQFYLVFPLVAAFAIRRRLLPAIVIVIIAASLALQLAFGGDVDRTYFGTDTRAAELAAGVGLAIALPGIRRLLAGRTVLADSLGVVALVATTTLFLAANLGEFASSGGLTAVTVVWISLLVASVCGERMPALLGRGVLPGIGRISYGIYLYHWPVYLLATSQRTGLDGSTLLLVRVSTTLLLAVGSSLLLELPIRRRSLRFRPVIVTSAAAVASIVVATMVVPRPSELGGPVHTAATLTPPPPISSNTTTPTATTVSAGVESNAAESNERIVSIPPAGGTPALSTTTAPDRTRRPPRILVVGDSTAGVNGIALQKTGAADGTAEVYVFQDRGCVIYPPDAVLFRTGYIHEPECGDIIGEAVRIAQQVDPDALVVFIGSAQLFDARYEGNSEFRSFLNPLVFNRYREVLSNSARRLSKLGIPVLWADVPAPALDIDEFGQLLGSPMPGTGVATSNDPARAELLNQIDETVLGRARGVLRWGYTSAIAGPDGRIDPEHRPDGLHLDPAYAERAARESILPALQAAYREAVRQHTGVSIPVEDLTAWSP